ncbi:hypothetical protein [Helicobacter bizzozeronii]|uniref:hypothetical protein n=1 Tax=Helicobacter bizzozeronii TaxID=56877 RepID=UPI00024E5A7F|nr:hypothetical protein [Helicobacter bizzozeronii]CCF80911.1 conserved hypothetical protein [Helicobacter bizzozeronii CCUG 35545]
MAEHHNKVEQEPQAKNLAEEKQENNSEQLSQPEQGLETSNESTSELAQTPLQATEIDNKYAKLHSYFKQVELDVQQKRIKTKTDFKESFLNYAKSHMTEAELKVLLVLSQKQPSKLTQEHLNLINDALEQAHGNKHMQDLGLQLSVKAVLGHPLEAEQYTAIQSYVQQCQASLEPMDGKVADAMNSHLAKMQKSRETPTESQAVQQEATQIRETIAEPSQNATQPITAPPPEPWIQSQNSHKPWLETQTQDTQASHTQTAQQKAKQGQNINLGSATTHTAPNESEQQTQDYSQAQPVASSRPTPPPEPWLESQNSKPWLEIETQDMQASHTQAAIARKEPSVHLGSPPSAQPWLDAPAKPRGRRR